MTFYLDTETTGLYGAEMVECAVVDDDGKTILDTLVNPGRPIPTDASRIHGITDKMVELAPPADAVRAFVLALVRGHRLVIYNADYDCQFFPGIREMAKEVRCCMKDASEHFGEWSDYHQSYRWPKLGVAARACGHVDVGDAHRARADALACRTVWHWLQDQPVDL
jgi:DNA polymerase III epsilon subunit-like protein